MLECSPGEIHLWSWALDAEAQIAERDLNLLSPGEKKRADDFLHLPARVRFIERRAGTRRILAQYGDHPPQCMNLSSSGDHVILAASAAPVGVDIERCAGRTLLAAERYLHPRERDWLAAQPNPERAIDRLWVCKESFLKFTGEGLHRKLSSFAVETVSDNHARVRDDARGDVTIHLFDEAGPTIIAVAFVGDSTIRRMSA